jgi:GDP-4-dehydro-6-deoxy-D-mannose reductase
MNGTVNVFEAVKKIRQTDKSYDPLVVVACSSAEYGASLTPENSPVNEDTPLLPLHPYGVSKVGQDLLSFQYWMNFKIRCIRVRIFNTTGARKTNDVTSDFVQRFEFARSRK